MRVENLSLEKLDKIKKSAKIEDLKIYLRPKYDEFGSAAAPSKIYSVKYDEVDEVDDEVVDIKSDFLSRFWLEIVGVIDGYFDEDGEFKTYEEDYDYFMDENIEVVLGVVTGYVIDKNEFSYHNDYGNSSEIAITFDCISQILSDLWCALVPGSLSELIEEHDEYFGYDKAKVIYYLDNIYYKEGFEDLRIDKAVLKLLESAVDTYLNKDLEDVIYEPWRSDLFEPTGFLEASREHYVKRAKVFKDEGYGYVEGANGLEYYLHTKNDYFYINTEEIELEDIEGIELEEEDISGESLNECVEDKEVIQKKEIKDLSFRLTLFENKEDDDDDLFGNRYEVCLKDDMKLDKKDLENLSNWMMDFDKYCEEGMINLDLSIFDGGNRVGIVKCNFINKVKNIARFISETEATSGDAGVCACEIVSQGLFKDKVQGRKYAYIEWINLDEEYKTLENEIIVLRSVLEFMKINCRVKRVFTRPIPVNLTDGEEKVQRCKYASVEWYYYDLYGKYMVGYVRSYYSDTQSNLKYLDSLSKDEYNKLVNSYEEKFEKTIKAYEGEGMQVLNNNGAGVMYIEF